MKTVESNFYMCLLNIVPGRGIMTTNNNLLVRGSANKRLGNLYSSLSDRLVSLFELLNRNDLNFGGLFALTKLLLLSSRAMPLRVEQSSNSSSMLT